MSDMAILQQSSLRWSVKPSNVSRFKLPDKAVQLASGQSLVAGGNKQIEIYGVRQPLQLIRNNDVRGNAITSTIHHLVEVRDDQIPECKFSLKNVLMGSVVSKLKCPVFLARDMSGLS
jgi:hypothetical protein